MGRGHREKRPQANLWDEFVSKSIHASMQHLLYLLSNFA